MTTQPGVLVQEVAKVVEHAKQEMEAGWRPVVEAAWAERDALRAELEEERQQRRADQQRYARRLDLAAFTARADSDTIASLRAWVLELEDKLGVPRPKVTA